MVMSLRSLLLRPKATARNVQRMVVAIAQKTPITEATNHLYVADGFISSDGHDKRYTALAEVPGRYAMFVVYEIDAMLCQLSFQHRMVGDFPVAWRVRSCN